MFFLEQLPVVSLKQWSHIVIVTMLLKSTKSIVFFTKHGSFGYLAAVAMPLDLPNRNVYVAFNFEANYGLPSNDSYHEWIDRWNLDEEFLGIDNNVTAIDGRQMVKSKRTPHQPPYYGRQSFYQTFVGYLNYFHMNGTACLLRTICEIASSNLDENNGVLGSIFKILFMPTTSTRETPSPLLLPGLTQHDLYQAEYRGTQSKTQTEVTTDNHDMDIATNCLEYMDWCPQEIINMISTLY